MVRLGTAAIRWAEEQSRNPSRNWFGLCQMFTRMAFGAPGGAKTAALAWANNGGQHPGDLNPPPAVPVYWTGGSSGAGHAAVSAGGGNIWSTDIKRHGKVDLVSIAYLNSHWGLPYAGWTEKINGVKVYKGQTATSPAPPGVPGPPVEDDSPLFGGGRSGPSVAGMPPAEGQITGVDGGKCSFVIPAYHPTKEWGPVPYHAMAGGDSQPDVGDNCVVVFVGVGMDAPRVVAWYPTA